MTETRFYYISGTSTSFDSKPSVLCFLEDLDIRLMSPEQYRREIGGKKKHYELIRSGATKLVDHLKYEKDGLCLIQKDRLNRDFLIVNVQIMVRIVISIGSTKDLWQTLQRYFDHRDAEKISDDVTAELKRQYPHLLTNN